MTHPVRRIPNSDRVGYDPTNIPWADMWVAYPVTADPLFRDLIRALQDKWGLKLSMEYDHTRRETAFRFRLRPTRAPAPRPRFWNDVQCTSSNEYLQGPIRPAPDQEI